jgi:hypothetical protein
MLAKALFAIISTFCATAFTHAESQPFTPTDAYQTLNTFIDGQALYVLGGKLSDELPLSQMFLLDLSTSWSTSSPAFKKLPDGYGDYSMPNALTSDQQTWFILSNGIAYAYKFETSSWKTLTQDSDINKNHGNAAATDPETGLIYVPNGYSDWWTGKKTMMIYSAADKTFDYDSMQPSLLNMYLYTATWSPDLKGMLIFGGVNFKTNITTNDLLFYHPSDGWRLLETKGDIPPPRRSHCFVPAYSGSKMVLFGGRSNPTASSLESSPTLGDLYILDVPSLTWTRGSDADSTGARWGHACAMSNDYFVAWGGVSMPDAEVLNLTIVYNLKTASWTTEYVYSPPPNQADKKAIAIGCGAAGGVLLLVAVILIFRRHQAKGRLPPAEIVEVPKVIEVVSPTPHPVSLPMHLQGPPHVALVPFDPMQQQNGYPPVNPVSAMASPLSTHTAAPSTPASHMFSNSANVV